MSDAINFITIEYKTGRTDWMKIFSFNLGLIMGSFSVMMFVANFLIMGQ